MSREFKFRIWNKATGEYEYTDKGLKLTFPGISANSNVIVEQWTGLKDKNGKEIYEGDIIEYFTNWGSFGTVVYDAKFGYCIEYKIEYEEKILRTRQEYFADIQSEVEVVGSIHENVDLMEVSE